MSDNAQATRDTASRSQLVVSLFAAALAATASIAALGANPAAAAVPVKPVAASAVQPAASQAGVAAKPAAAAAGRAPTIQTMSDLYAAEMAAQAQKRLEKLYPPQAASAAQPAAAVKPVVKPVFFESKAEVPTMKRVLAIYGRAGAEVADLERPDGTVVAVRPGATFEGYRVLRVTPKFVELEGRRSVSDAPGADKKGSKGQSPAAGGAEEASAARRIARVETFSLKQAVGSTFK